MKHRERVQGRKVKEERRRGQESPVRKRQNLTVILVVRTMQRRKRAADLRKMRKTNQRKKRLRVKDMFMKILLVIKMVGSEKTVKRTRSTVIKKREKKRTEKRTEKAVISMDTIKKKIEAGRRRRRGKEVVKEIVVGKTVTIGVETGIDTEAVTVSVAVIEVVSRVEIGIIKRVANVSAAEAEIMIIVAASTDPAAEIVNVAVSGKEAVKAIVLHLETGGETDQGIGGETEVVKRL